MREGSPFWGGEFTRVPCNRIITIYQASALGGRLGDAVSIAVGRFS